MTRRILATAALLAGAAVAPAHAEGAVETIIVTASPLARGMHELSQSAAQLSRDELIASGGFGLGDALAHVPGVASSGFAPGAARPVIRGFDAARVRVTENGLGSHDVSDVSADHGVPVDPLAAREIEVIRGPGTLRYGSQAIGGVVNAINNRIPFSAPAEHMNYEVLASYGANANERMAGGLADVRAGNFVVHIDGIFREADSYDTGAGEQANSFSSGNSQAMGGAYVANGIAAGLSFSRYASEYGIPPEPGAAEIATIDLEQSRWTGAVRFDAPIPGIETLNVEGTTSDYTHDEVVAGEGVAATFNNDEWEARGELVHQGFGPIARGAFGIQTGRRDFEALGEAEEYLLPTRTDSLAFYVFEEIALGDDLTAELSLRTERADVKGEIAALGAFDRDFEPLSYAAGLVFRATDALSLTFNASRTARAPNAVELYAQGPHEASATFELGDPTLSEEKATSFEAGLRYEGADGLRFSAAGFHSAFEGFVAGVLTGNSYDEDGNFFPDDSEEFAELFYTQADATFWGFEAEARLPLGEAWNGTFGIDLQADYVRAEFDGGGNVPRITPLRYGGGFFFESADTDLRLRVRRVDEQDKIAANETPTDGYTTLDAAATFRAYEGDGGALDLSLIGVNLTDELARNHVSFTKDHVALPGRDVRLVLRFVR